MLAMIRVYLAMAGFKRLVSRTARRGRGRVNVSCTPTCTCGGGAGSV